MYVPSVSQISVKDYFAIKTVQIVSFSDKQRLVY